MKTGKETAGGQPQSRKRLSILKAERIESGLPGIGHPRQEPAERTLIADMSGTVRLEDEELTAIFSEGTISNLLYRGEPVLEGIAAESYYIEESEQIHFYREGAFSFEGKGLHGLRAAASIRGEGIRIPGSLVYDYFFMENYTCLFVSITCVYPIFHEGREITSLAVLDIPLYAAKRGDSFHIEGRYMNGERYQVSLPGTKCSYLLPGSTFSIGCSHNTLTLSYPESENNYTRILPVSVTRRGRGALLRISPEGFTGKTAGSAISGFSYHSLFALQVQAGGKVKHTPFRSDIYREIGKPWVKFTGLPDGT